MASDWSRGAHRRARQGAARSALRPALPATRRARRRAASLSARRRCATSPCTDAPATRLRRLRHVRDAPARERARHRRARAPAASAPASTSARSTSRMAGMIDHTLLKADATADDVKKLCDEARKYCFASVCVNSTNVGQGAALPRRLGRDGVRGGRLPARRDDADGQGVRGARGGALRAPTRSTWSSTSARSSRATTRSSRTTSARWCRRRGRRKVKVILETGALTHEEKIIGITLSKIAGAHFVKTSTGFGPGGATVEDIALMRQARRRRDGRQGVGRRAHARGRREDARRRAPTASAPRRRWPSSVARTRRSKPPRGTSKCEQTKIDRVILIVLDSCGCGAAPDAGEYGDDGSDTLGNMSVKRRRADAAAPAGARARPPDDHPRRAAGGGAARRVRQDARGVGGQGHDHRPLGDGRAAGRQRRSPPSPRASPPEMMARFEKQIGRGTLGNKTGVGHRDHRRARAASTWRPASRSSTRRPTRCSRSRRTRRSSRSTSCIGSARWRGELCDEIPVARVIARPFVGEPGTFKRTYNRRDFSMPPPTPTVLDSHRRRQAAGRRRGQDLGHLRRARRHREHALRGQRRRLRAHARGAWTRVDARARLHQPRRLRHALRPPPRSRRATTARCRSSTRSCRGCRRSSGRATSSSSPPTTATTRPIAAPTIRASTCRSSPWARARRGHDLGVRNGFYDIAQTLADAFGVAPRRARAQLPVRADATRRDARR